MAAVSVALGLLAIGVPLSWGVPLAKRDSLSAIKDGDKPGPPPIGEDLRRAISETPSLAYLQVDELFKDPKEAVRRAQQQVSEDMRTSMGPEKICNLNTFLQLARESAAKLTVVHEASLAFAAFNESLTSTLQKHPLEHCPSAPALSPQCPDPVMHVIVPAYRESLKDQSGAWGCHVNWKALAEVLTCQHVDVGSPAAYAEWARLVEKVSHVTCYRSNALAPLMDFVEPPLPEEHNTTEVRAAVAKAQEEMQQLQKRFQSKMDAIFEGIKHGNISHADDAELERMVEELNPGSPHIRLSSTAPDHATNLIRSQAEVTTQKCADTPVIPGVLKPSHCQMGPVTNFFSVPLTAAQCGGDCSKYLCVEECNPDIYLSRPECNPATLSAPMFMYSYLAIMPFKVDLQCHAWSDAHYFEEKEAKMDEEQAKAATPSHGDKWGDENQAIPEAMVIGKGKQQPVGFWMKQPPMWLDWFHLNTEMKFRMKYKGACRSIRRFVANSYDSMLVHAEAQVINCLYFNGNRQCQSSMAAANYLARETSPFAGLGSLNPWAYDKHEFCQQPTDKKKRNKMQWIRKVLLQRVYEWWFWNQEYMTFG